jgi:uncharacterized RDD family membrane protein YckC
MHMSSSSKFDFLWLTGLRKRRQTPEMKKYASFNRRMWAATIDSLILILLAPFIDAAAANYAPPVQTDITTLISKMQSNPDREAASKEFWEDLRASGHVDRWVANTKLQIAIFCIFSAICWHFWGGTPGKLAMRMRIVDAKTEKPISDYQIFLRVGGYFVSGTVFGLGFIWIAFSKRRQGWHDYIAGTAVIVIPWRKVTQATEAAGPSGSPAPSAAE